MARSEAVDKEMYINNIVEILKNETDYTDEDIKKMKLYMVKYDVDDLYRLYDAFYRFGVKAILESVN